MFCNVILIILMFTTISTYYTFPKTIEQICQNMTGHMTSRYQGLNSSDVGAKIENLGTRLELSYPKTINCPQVIGSSDSRSTSVSMLRCRLLIWNHRLNFSRKYSN